MERSLQTDCYSPHIDGRGTTELVAKTTAADPARRPLARRAIAAPGREWLRRTAPNCSRWSWPGRGTLRRIQRRIPAASFTYARAPDRHFPGRVGFNSGLRSTPRPRSTQTMDPRLVQKWHGDISSSTCRLSCAGEAVRAGKTLIRSTAEPRAQTRSLATFERDMISAKCPAVRQNERPSPEGMLAAFEFESNQRRCAKIAHSRTRSGSI